MQARKVFLLLLGAIAMPGLLFGFVTPFGGRGLYRVEDARSQGYGWLAIRGTGVYRETTYNRHKLSMLDLPAGIDYAFTDWLEVFGGTGYSGAGISDSGISLPILGRLPKFEGTELDARVGVKACFTHWLPVLKVGALYNHQFAYADTSKWVPDHPIPIGQYNELRGLLTANLQDAVAFLPIAIHVNYGKTWGPGGMYVTRPSPVNAGWFMTGIGAELAFRDFQIFGELSGVDTSPIKPPVITNSARQYLSYGARVRIGVFGIGLTFDQGLTPNLPPFTTTLGLSFLTAVLAKEAGSATLLGTVVDERSGSPLPGVVMLPQTRGYKNRQTNLNSDGTFKLTGVPAGSVLLEVDVPGYQRYAEFVSVEGGKTAIQSIRLSPLKQYGTITGKVTDARSGAPVAAMLSFPGSNIASRRNDSATGVYRAESLNAGAVVVSASAMGYLNGTATVTVKENEVSSQDFELVPSRSFGSVSGTVTDAATGRPIRASVGFSDSTLPRVEADSVTGFYTLDQIPVGVSVLNANADGYFPAQAAVTIEPNGLTTQNFTLSPSAQYGQLTGIVVDKATRGPLVALVYFPNSSTPPVTSDSTTGLYKVQVPLGPVAVACSLPGYARQVATTPVMIRKGEPAILNFEMLKIGTEITLTNDAVHFARGSAEIQPDGYPALDEWVRLLKENPLMTAEIQGHTDAVGSEAANQRLSERRAQAVANYLVSQGVDISRLTVVGYGKSQLLVPTQEANSQNRRVVFKVTGEKR